MKVKNGLPLNLVYGISILAHLALTLFGAWQDANLTVKYSDIDYEVFTDAAAHVINGESPYERHTYRYTPLLAYVLTPNIFISKTFGKILFSSMDIAIGLLLESLLDIRRCSKSLRSKLLVLWLWNPIIIQVSTRGNADSLAVLFVLLTLLAIRQRKWVLAGILLGFSVHLRIFPFIIGIPCLLAINPLYMKSRNPSLLTHLLSPISTLSFSQWIFCISSFMTFFGLAGIFYILYGWKFLFESYFYHIIRIDHRHNLSPFFYLLYLTHLVPSYRKILSFITFLPQWVPTFYIGCRYARQDLESSVFLQILIFVIFNKVCTAQYFVWWMGLLPLISDYCIRYTKNPESSYWISTFFFIILWAICQGCWLYFGFQLEFLGKSVFIQICLAGLLFFFSGIALVIHFTRAMKRTASKIT